MRALAICSLALLSSCVNPMHQGRGGAAAPNVPPSAASMRNPWGGDTSGWASAQNAPAPAPAPTSGDGFAWNSTAPGDRAPTARTVPPGSSGAGLTNASGTPVVDLQRGLGGPVPSQPLGTVADQSGPGRNTIEDSSRAMLFEEVTRLQDDRDALRQQLADMSVQFQRLEAQAQSQAALHQTTAQESSSLRARIEQLEEHNRQLQLENEDLAGRLLTAQIRRLEAEKVLLEHLIAAEQSRANALGARSAPPEAEPATTGAGATTGGQP